MWNASPERYLQRNSRCFCYYNNGNDSVTNKGPIWGCYCSPPWTLDEMIEKYFLLRKFRCTITFFIPWGPPENMSIEVNHVSHETLWETRVHKTRRHHKDGEIWFIVRLDTFPLQMVCYYYCYRREKSKGVGIVSSGFVSNEWSQRVIMTDNERCDGKLNNWPS